MKIQILENGFYYDNNVFNDSSTISDVLKYPDCDGVDYTTFCPKGRVLSEAQQETADFMMENKRCYVFNGMGTGKTMSSLMVILALLRMKPGYRVLIISSKTVLASGWVPEVQAVCPWCPIILCEGAPEKKKKILENRNNQLVGCSADSLHIVPRGAFDMIIADEATLFKSAQGVGGSARGKQMCELASHNNTERLVLMTGTPRAHSCMDAYGLYFVMNDKYRRDKTGRVLNKTMFRNALCVPMDFQTYYICRGYKTPEQWDRWKGTTCGGLFINDSLEDFRDRLNHCSRDAKNMWIERPNANESLMSLLSPAIAFRTEDVLDLPDCPIIDVHLDMSDEDRATLNKMKRDMLLDFEDKKDIISNKMVLEGKMEQVNCGLVYDSDGAGRILLSSVYKSALKFVLTHAQRLPSGRGLVIASRYNHILYTVYKALEIVLGSGCVNMINGEVSSKDRTRFVNEFRNGTTRILLANTACLSHGVTLVEANEMILLDTPQYTEPYVQVKGRVHRRGQKWPIPIYRLIGNATVGRRFNILEGAEERDDDFVRLISRDE